MENPADAMLQATACDALPLKADSVLLNICTPVVDPMDVMPKVTVVSTGLEHTLNTPPPPLLTELKLGIESKVSAGFEEMRDVEPKVDRLVS